jgi:hypothetical protein
MRLGLGGIGDGDTGAGVKAVRLPYGTDWWARGVVV